jgi:diguanylate cyclase (GGDEF)-like protein
MNPPTVFAIIAFIRVVQWFRVSAEITATAMLRRLQETHLLTAVLCLGILAWCLNLVITTDDITTAAAVILFGGLTAIGTAYGLSSLPIAARIPLFVLALPLAGSAFVSRDPRLYGAALSVAIVAALILRILTVQNNQFIEVIRSRSLLDQERAQTEVARQEAVAAAQTDFLTGLLNRRAFVSALDAAFRSSSGAASVAILDLDNFKLINDTLGHAVGDSLLQNVSERLLKFEAFAITIARLGGDEFGFLIPDLHAHGGPTVLGERILAEVSRPALLMGRQVTAAASIGFGFARQGDLRTPSRVLADADIALYEAKRVPGTHLAVFEPCMEEHHQKRAKVEAAVRSHDFKERVHLRYQPIFELKTREILAIEALARWTDDDLGEVSPAEFIPIAERLHVISELSQNLLSRALVHASCWPSHVRLSFNLSGVQLSRTDFGNDLIGALRAAEFDPSRLQVEVTETALLSDFSAARENLAVMKAYGISTVLDDFGAGYSSLGYLRELRFDQIKIDGVLVKGATGPNEGRELLSGVIHLCRALGAMTVAEHIETEDEYTLVAELGCYAGQGYWLQEPMTASDASMIVREKLR